MASIAPRTLLRAARLTTRTVLPNPSQPRLARGATIIASPTPSSGIPPELTFKAPTATPAQPATPAPAVEAAPAPARKTRARTTTTKAAAAKTTKATKTRAASTKAAAEDTPAAPVKRTRRTKAQIEADAAAKAAELAAAEAAKPAKTTRASKPKPATPAPAAAPEPASEPAVEAAAPTPAPAEASPPPAPTTHSYRTKPSPAAPVPDEAQARALAAAERVARGDKLPPKYKGAARRITALIVALPFVIVGTPLVYERVVEGKERKMYDISGGLLGAAPVAEAAVTQGAEGAVTGAWEGRDGAVKSVEGH